MALMCKYLAGSHTAESIANTLNHRFISHGIDTRKIAAALTDGGTNYVKCFNEFAIEEKHSLLFGKKI